MEALLAHSVTYRIAAGPRAGRKVFTLQTLPAGDDPCSAVAGQAAGFSLHASVAARADERKKLERLCRYISRPAVSEARLSLTPGRPGALPTQDAIPRRHHARALRAAGFHRKTGRAGAHRESISLATTACSRRTAPTGRG
jgi:hypothetical protein